MMKFEARVSQRYQTRLTVMVCSVLESHIGQIVDLSTHGAKIECKSLFEPGEKIALDVGGERVLGTITWIEIDRMGVKFFLPLETGPIHGELVKAINAEVIRVNALSNAIGARERTFGRRSVEPDQLVIRTR